MLGKTYVYTYDNAGNRTSKKTYTYTTGSLASLTYIEEKYEYSNTWGDQLTKVDSTTISYDAIGNPTTFNGYTLTWFGRQLKKMEKSGSVIEFTYNADGIRTSKEVNNVEHIYTLNGSQIVSESWGSNLLIYLYDESGSPIGMQYRTTSYAANTFDTFYFEKNLQGDIIAVYNASGKQIGSYTYDAWGNGIASVFSSNTALENNVVRTYNPFRYRGYYYDTETQLYYLQSRYYNPQWGRFLNADGLVSTGTGILGYNMYTYCDNNPVTRADYYGDSWLSDAWEKIKEFCSNTFGAGVVQSENYDEMTIDTLIFGEEYGSSETKVICGDIGKPISVYAKNASEWWKIWDYKVGIQINIGDGGFYFELNTTERALGISAGNKTVEFMSGLNKIGVTASYDVDFSERTSKGIYYHGYVRTIPTAVAVGAVYVTYGAAVIPLIERLINTGAVAIP